MSLTANRDLYNQVSGIGSSFVDNYMKGTKIRMAQDQKKRNKRREQFSFWDSEQKEYQRQINLYGKEQAEAWASARRGSEEYTFHQIPENIKLAPTGSTITLTGEKAINAIMNINKLPNTNEGRKAAKANIDAFGYGDSVVFNVFGSNNIGKINHEETRKIDTYKLKSDISKTDIMKKQAEIIKSQNDILGNDKNAKIGRNFRDSYLKDKEIEQARSSLYAASSIRALLDENNPIADRAMKIQLPRLLGEVGNLAQKEQENFGGSQAITEKIKQIIKTAKTGEFTETNKKYISGIVDALSKSAKSKYNERSEKLIDSESRIGDVSKDYLRSIVDPFIHNDIGKSSSAEQGNNDPLGLF